MLVSQVTEGSAAEKAGIKPGDVITSINGQTIKSNSELRNAIGLSRVGDKLDVALIRDRKPLHVTAIITELPQTTAQCARSKTGGARGLRPACIPASQARRWRMRPKRRRAGARHRAAQRGGLAQLFRTGDRIEGANRQNVANLKRAARSRQARRRAGADGPPRQRRGARAAARAMSASPVSARRCPTF